MKTLSNIVILPRLVTVIEGQWICIYYHQTFRATHILRNILVISLLSVSGYTLSQYALRSRCPSASTCPNNTMNIYPSSLRRDCHFVSVCLSWWVLLEIAYFWRYRWLTSAFKSFVAYIVWRVILRSACVHMYWFGFSRSPQFLALLKPYSPDTL